MSRINTRPKNRDQHPGIVDLSPQRRTQAHKRVDDERSAEDKQAREEARKAGIRRLAEVEERNAEKLKMMATGPKPRPRMVTSASNATDFTGKCM